MSTAVPTESTERIAALDAIRGVAVLGILIMNIVAFGMPAAAYDNPIVWGGSEGADRTVWEIASLFFEGTMRGLFTLLFGAGALLFLRRHAARDPTLRPADLYFRRTLWLIVFGLVNGYLLLWQGDILFFYGVVGLFLFVFRDRSPKFLILVAAVALTVPTIVSTVTRANYEHAYRAAAVATRLAERGVQLSPTQLRAIERLEDMNRDHRPPHLELEEQVEAMQGNYATVFSLVAEQTEFLETKLFFRIGFAECFGMMLLGMALFRLNILTGRAPTLTYVLLLTIGYSIGLSVNMREVSLIEADHFGASGVQAAALTYDVGRIPMTLGHVGLLCLLLRIAAFAPVARVLAATGQMALTNYLMQSVLCALIFTGVGFGLYGQLHRHELYYVVGAIWILQLIWSPLWLTHYQFGPAEWLWRTLTYGKRQPMRRVPVAAEPPLELLAPWRQDPE